jgi:hypothetical protein
MTLNIRFSPRALGALLAAALALPPASNADTPLEAAHPAFTLTSLRQNPGFKPMVGGMDFLSNGDLVIGHWGGDRNACCPSGSDTGSRQYTGKVYVVRGATGDNPVVSVDTLVSGLEDVMGLVVVRDTIYVSGGNQIVRLIRSGLLSGAVTRLDTVFILPGKPRASGPLAGDSLRPLRGRSEWMYGLLHRNGKFYVNPSSMYSSGTNQISPNRGVILEVTPGDGASNKRGSFTRVATGFRHHTGLTWGPDSMLWTTDTQGPWIPTNKLIAVKPGAFYGHKHTPAEAWDNLPESPAAVFLPQGSVSSGGSSGGSGTKNAFGVFSNSPGQPLYLTSGPYAGQMILGDLSYGGVQRFFVEKVNDSVWQGAGMHWMGGLEAQVYRMAQGPDGQIYLGMIGASGDWSWNGQYFGLQKVKYNGAPAFEVLAVKSRKRGMEVEFTKPLDTLTARNPDNYTISTYYYTPGSGYGGTQTSVATLVPGTITLSPDRKSAFIHLPGLTARTGSQHRIVEFTFKTGLRSATQEALPAGMNKAYYSLNAISNTGAFGGDPAPVDPALTRARVKENLKWSVLSDRMEIDSPFRGAYTLRLLDARGALLARASGNGAETALLRVPGLRGRLAVLVAEGDGVTLRKTVLLP